MKKLQIRCYRMAVGILVAGLSIAGLIYWATGESDDLAGAYQVIIADGVAYPVPAASNKVYVRELERFGGKAAVLFDEWNRWFASLWQGRRLAWTVAWLSAAVAAGLFLFARHWLDGPDDAEG